MRICSAAEVRECERVTFHELKVPSRAVLEVAGRAVADLIIRKYSIEAKSGVLVLCGGGNNGGDSAVAARALLLWGFDVAICLPGGEQQLAGDLPSALLAFANSGGRLVSEAEVLGADSEKKFSFGLVVDGLFGTGYNRPMAEELASVVRRVNEGRLLGKWKVLAIDLPSGVLCDSGQIPYEAIRADATLSFQCVKPCHVLAPASEHAGTVFVADIGVHLKTNSEPEKGVIRSLLGPADIRNLVSEKGGLAPSAHKGTRGHVLIVGGSSGKLGAPYLSALGAMRAGAGLATVAAPQAAWDSLKPKTPQIEPEIMGTSFPEGLSPQALLEQIQRELSGKKAVVIGPGLGTSDMARRLLQASLAEITRQGIPCVIDADALNLLAEDWSIFENLNQVPRQFIFTPHPAEASRLLKRSVAEISAARFEAAAELVLKTSSVILLKGANSIIASGRRVWVTPHAAPALATAGSGDTLAGIIAGLLAQGYSLEAATQLGVYVHGEIGVAHAHVGILAHEISDAVPEVLAGLKQGSWVDSRPARDAEGFLTQILPSRRL